MIPIRLLRLLSEKPFSVTTKVNRGVTDIRMAFDNPYADITYQHREDIQAEIEAYLIGISYSVESGQVFDKVFSSPSLVKND